MTDVAGAFLLGLLSASSLGLGALTSRFWRPTNFVLGLLTAFGAGALLSAVTIDIIAPSVEADEFGWLAVGAVGGGLAFEILNRTINARGGFLRKASTSITFLKDREQRRIRAILEDLERIDFFDGLPTENSTRSLVRFVQSGSTEERTCIAPATRESTSTSSLGVRSSWPPSKERCCCGPTRLSATWLL